MDEKAMHSGAAEEYVDRMAPEYDASRATYSLTRRPDPRIAAAIERALGDARTVASVGAYESPEREVLAVEPSPAMRAEDLPLGDRSVDAAVAVLTVHHWRDQRRGLAELRRVARRRVVVFTFDPAEAESFWLVRDYLPEIAALDRERLMPIDELVAALGGELTTVERVPIPHDCRDGFLGAFWRRPERYLDRAPQPGNSAFADLDARVLERGLAKLENDLEAGVWRRRYGGLLSREELDVGYRLVIAELSAEPST